ERHGIEIQLDRKSLSDAKKSPGTPISIGLRGVPLRDALKQLLEKYGLETAVRHEVLLIGGKPLKAPLEIPSLPAGRGISPKLAKALRERTELEFVDQPLSAVVEYLMQRHEIEIALDNAALTKAGVGSDTPLTRNVKGISLKSGLELMLGEIDLTCFAEGD